MSTALTIHVPSANTMTSTEPRKILSIQTIQECVVLGKDDVGILELENGAYNVVGSWNPPLSDRMYHQTLACGNLCIIGQGQGETILYGRLVAEGGKTLNLQGITIKNPRGVGLVADGEGTQLDMRDVTIEECKSTGVRASNGATINAAKCQFKKNGGSGFNVSDTGTSASLTDCTFVHNVYDGVSSSKDAVMNLMGEETSMHDNKRYGMHAFDCGTINVHTDCDVFIGNKGENVCQDGGVVVEVKRNLEGERVEDDVEEKDAEKVDDVEEEKEKEQEQEQEQERGRSLEREAVCTPPPRESTPDIFFSSVV